MNEQPSRELDVQVHRALWPDALIERLWVCYDYDGESPFVVSEEDAQNSCGECEQDWFYQDNPVLLNSFKPIPRYTTDLSAWKDWRRVGWLWEISEAAPRVQVILRIMPYHGDYIYAEVLYAECGGDHHAAWALGMSRCVLKWAERQDGESGQG